jgi:hypothetical protein
MVREEQKFISINSLSTPKRAGNGNVLPFQDCQQHHPSADFFFVRGWPGASNRRRGLVALANDDGKPLGLGQYNDKDFDLM